VIHKINFHPISYEFGIDFYLNFENVVEYQNPNCWGHASSPKVLQEETPSLNPFERSAEATTHEASVL
jgi:hypothetical protein